MPQHTPTRRRRRRRRRPFLLFISLLALAGVAIIAPARTAAWTALARLRRVPGTLAVLTPAEGVPRHDLAVVALAFDGALRLPLRWSRSGALVPTRHLSHGAVRILVVARRRGLPEWLPFSAERLTLLRAVPAAPRLAFRREAVPVGGPVPVVFTHRVTRLLVVMGSRRTSLVLRGRRVLLRVPPDVTALRLTPQRTSWNVPRPPETLLLDPVQDGSFLRIQEMLADLRYLPLTFQPRRGGPWPDHCPCRLRLQHPPQGSFLWRYRLPSTLERLWQPGDDTVVTQGALMQFDRVHHLPILPYPTPATVARLSVAWERDEQDPDDYSYAFVSETLPERLTIWADGRVVLRSLVNTALPPAHTHVGTFPIFLRYRAQTMSGTAPDGAPYVYPDVPYVNYFKGNDALHGFPRAAYGFPQSAGCVELPIPKARIAYGYLHYGSLVTVAPPA